MLENDLESLGKLHAISRHGTHSVTCLECGTNYPKPVRGGTTARNPGCPKCGYVGWLEVEVTVRDRTRARRRQEDFRLSGSH